MEPIFVESGDYDSGSDSDPEFTAWVDGLMKKMHEKRRLQKFAVTDDNAEKKIVCSICKERFAYQSVLDVHMIRHARKDPHECSKCNATFKWKVSLINHEKKGCQGQKKVETISKTIRKTPQAGQRRKAVFTASALKHSSDLRKYFEPIKTCGTGKKAAAKRQQI